MKRKIFFVILIALGFSACKELYNPEVSAVHNILVVEGLITDQPGYYMVKLNYAVPFDTVTNYNRPALGANVTIKDNLGNIYALSSDNSGHYYTDSATLIGKVGNTYTLHIQTKEGDVYESTPALIPQPHSIDSIYGQFTTKKYLFTFSPGYTSTIEEHGISSIVNMNNNNSELPLIRFTSDLLMEYTYLGPPTSPPSKPVTYFGWITKNLDDLYNLTGTTYTTGTNSILNHTVCFFSKDNKNYDLPASLQSQLWIINITHYSLNNDSYTFYKGIYDQLASTGKLFDPITAQLSGNIKCINDPNKLVFGLFEASTLTISSYIVNFNSATNLFKYTKLNTPVKVSGSSPTISNPPSFWVN